MNSFSHVQADMCFFTFFFCIVRIVVLPLMLSMSRHNSEECFDKVQRTMLEIVNQLDGFDSRGNVKVGSGQISVQLLGNI